ncbi:hypothetical protein AB0C51_18370 [Streptomyces pathocidini]|uniref:hypothetical protein n=1 Tax=Streptomyces pathocidini TaxID=1650571 RepID=UPI0033D623DC
MRPSRPAVHHTGRRPLRRSGRRAGIMAGLLAGAAVLVTGCGNGHEAVPAGPAATASAPVILWPERKPAKLPAEQDLKATADPVPGIGRVRSMDIRDVKPLDVIKAEVRSHAGERSGADGMDVQTVQAVEDCTAPGTRTCPVRTPQYHDLTGNGRDELIVGIDFVDGGYLALRAYTLDDHGKLLRILATIANPLSIEITRRELIIREPSDTPGYELRTFWAWDSRRQGLAIRGDEVRRVERVTPGTVSPSHGVPREPAPSGSAQGGGGR